MNKPANDPLHVIVLAAGQGTRMKSALPKVLHAVGGKPMLAHLVDCASALGAAAIHVVYGHGGEAVRAWFDAQRADAPLHWAHQAQQLGTAHAVQQALPAVPDAARVLILYGDVPLIGSATLQSLLDAAADGLGLLTVTLDDASGYGRIVRDAAGRVRGIVEEKDASALQRGIREANTGVMTAPAAKMRGWLAAVGNGNANGEYYLTDVVALAVAGKTAIATVSAPPQEVEGANDRLQLAQLERHFQRRQAAALMREGLGISDPQRFDLRGRLRFGRDVQIDVGVVIEGEVELGDGVVVGPYTVLRNLRVGAGTRIESHCVLEQAQLGADCRIGPYARIRPQAELADGVHIGNFVEVKKSRIGRGSKANHLSYIGDAEIGSGVNVGAGTITCNYDGANKHKTVIEDGVFIGSDTALVAPVRVGRNATIGAGSVITKDAPADALTLSRAREQKSFAGWQRPAKRTVKSEE